MPTKEAANTVRSFNRDKSLFYIQKDNYTVFYIWDGQLIGVYQGVPFILKPIIKLS